MPLQGQKETFSMYWMAELYSFESRGLEGSATYQDICGLYCSYVNKKYGNAIVVLVTTTCLHIKEHDTPEESSRESRSNCHPAFTENVKVTLKRDNFLANPTNKQRLINMRRFLQEDNCLAYHAEGDAGVLIVKTAVESARDRNTVLVGGDTDLLVLLCFYTH